MLYEVVRIVLNQMNCQLSVRHVYPHHTHRCIEILQIPDSWCGCINHLK